MPGRKGGDVVTPSTVSLTVAIVVIVLFFAFLPALVCGGN